LGVTRERASAAASDFAQPLPRAAIGRRSDDFPMTGRIDEMRGGQRPRSSTGLAQEAGGAQASVLSCAS